MEFIGKPISASVQKSEPIRGDPAWQKRLWDSAWSKEAERSVSSYINCYLRPYELRGKSVIDVGCGDMHSGSSRDMASWSGSFMGVDISDVAIAAARKNFPGGSFVRSNATFLPFDDRKFDMGISFNTIDFLGEEYFEALKEIARVSSKGVMFSVAHADNVKAQKIPGSRTTRHGMLHPSPEGLMLVSFSEAGVASLAFDLGFRRVKTQIKTRREMLQILYGDSVDLSVISKSTLDVKREMFVRLSRS